MKRKSLQCRIAAIERRANDARTINEKYDINRTADHLRNQLSRLEDKREEMKQQLLDMCIITVFTIAVIATCMIIVNITH